MFKEELFPQLITLPYKGINVGYNGYYDIQNDILALVKEFHPKDTSIFRVMIHELMHSTAHSSRLGRGLFPVDIRDLYNGDVPSKYLKEEMYAELCTYHLLNIVGGLTSDEERAIKYQMDFIHSIDNSLTLNEGDLHECVKISAFFLLDNLKPKCYSEFICSLNKLQTLLGRAIVSNEEVTIDAINLNDTVLSFYGGG